MYSWQRWHTVSVLPDDLIAFAWSAPMRELAVMVGISDVGLRKTLRGYGVVLPPQGHWNRVHAGRTVPPPPSAPPRRPGQTGRVEVDRRIAAHVPAAAPMSSAGPFASSEVTEDLDELRARELRAIGRAVVPRNLDGAHPGLQRLIRKEADRRKKAAEQRWYWDSPRFDKPIWQRQLRLLNGIFLALGRRGHDGRLGEGDYDISPWAIIGDMRVDITIEPVGKVRKVMRAGRMVPDPDLPASTPLQLGIVAGANVGRVIWQDDAEGKLEAKVVQIAAELIVAGEARLRRKLREDEERAERERLEREARDEQARLERERKRLARLRELNDQRIADLRRSGELLRLAADVRTLIGEVRAAVETRQDVDAATLESWEAWARAEADRIDPILSGQFLDHLRRPTVEGEFATQAGEVPLPEED